MLLSELVAQKTSDWQTFKTDPALDNQQMEQLNAELERMTGIFEQMQSQNPLDFSLNLKKEPIETGLRLKKRENIGLMKELMDVRTVLAEDVDENFLDMVFGLGEVIELCGMSCTGKTQICMQLCLNAQVPKVFGGVEGHALYIDTHGDFQAERVSEMAKSLRASVLKNIDKDPALLKKYREEFSIEKILSKI